MISGWRSRSGGKKDVTGLYYFGKRYYDPAIGRWLSVDPIADKYPSLSPYNYCANNPLKYVDLSGDSIDISSLTTEQLEALKKQLTILMQSKNFSRAWSTLSSSKTIYKIAINSSQTESALYDPKSNNQGSGGTLSFKGLSFLFSINAFSHELYHSYQHDQMGLSNSTGIEVEAQLFANSIATQVGRWDQYIFLGGNADYNLAMNTLFNNPKLDNKSWRSAINNYPRDIGDQRYNNLRPIYYNPLIRRFYPLIKI
ncbi:MAG: RHS repeat-associated core domain-containing protein [Candidatus Marinimicrobia bacterium]|jgi:RHS repeat-associated protein|nr:RHS repeat-associated core domain-containing protein [Candidatus Neomarinimicrobiota bacterium]MDD5230858.1 RHS repeat-associated core domain-containing protein [Candidatus Neomarinimicrobiota bacterium]MDD5539985.1 RHS repeat-associated core domain-containing protein [Candidatus Neomarinimicrobiota bacterium]